MDQGHYNCRDYHFTPDFSPTADVSETQHPVVERHESWDELEERSCSPASLKPKFPLLELPLELRQQIFGYLLPHTQQFLRDSRLLGGRARNFSAVRSSANGCSPSNVVWQRGNIHLLSVCKQLHRECAEMLYGTNTFLLFLAFPGISFRFRWLCPSGAAPHRSYNFIELLPQRYLHLIKRVAVHVGHVDSYTGMIKFNVDANGLRHGLRTQVRRLVEALQASNGSSTTIDDHRLARVYIRVSNGNGVLEELKSCIVQERECSVKVSEDIEEILNPFGQLRGVQQAVVVGAVNESYARSLEARMMSKKSPEDQDASKGCSCHWQAKDTTLGAFASSDDKRNTNLANLIRGF
jgi:hypothetical protein